MVPLSSFGLQNSENFRAFQSFRMFRIWNARTARSRRFVDDLLYYSEVFSLMQSKTDHERKSGRRPLNIQSGVHQPVHHARSQSVAFLAPLLDAHQFFQRIFQLQLATSKRMRILGWSQRGRSAFRAYRPNVSSRK